MAASEDLLGLIHEAVASDLLRQMLSGEASPQVIAQAIKFLKDNGIEAVAKDSDKLGQLAKSMPDFSMEVPLHERH